MMEQGFDPVAHTLQELEEFCGPHELVPSQQKRSAKSNFPYRNFLKIALSTGQYMLMTPKLTSARYDLRDHWS
jgi:hypothetical protein